MVIIRIAGKYKYNLEILFYEEGGEGHKVPPPLSLWVFLAIGISL